MSSFRLDVCAFAFNLLVAIERILPTPRIRESYLKKTILLWEDSIAISLTGCRWRRLGSIRVGSWQGDRTLLLVLLLFRQLTAFRSAILEPNLRSSCME